MGQKAHKRRSDGWGRALFSAVLAVAGHGVFATLLVFLSFVQVIIPPGPQRKYSPPRAVTLRSLSSDQWAKNRGPSAPTPDSPAQALRSQEKKPDPRPEGQVVDVAPGNEQEAPDAKYLAESSNRTKKETRARDQTAFYRNAMPQRTSTQPQQASGSTDVDDAVAGGNDGLGTDDRPLRSEHRALLEIPDVKRQQEIALKTDPASPGPGASVENRTESAEVRGNSNRLRLQPGGESGDESGSRGRVGKHGIATLLPSPSVLDKLSGAAPNDHLDAEEGEGTFLNTKEWKYSSFFNRVKQSVGMHWNPGRELRQRDPTGGIYGGRDRYTVLSVKLNDRGMVKDIYVEKSSGLDFLDVEAIHSFERAQPFPNPPPGLISTDSSVQFSFGFFLEMGGGPRLRLFRQAN